MNQIEKSPLLDEVARDATPLEVVPDVDAVWEEAEQLIEDALCDSDDTPKDIYAMLKRGDAFLLASDEGFAVLQEIPAPVGFDIIVWAAVSRTERGKRINLCNHLEQIENIAKDAGARYVAFYTARKGFARLMPKDWSIRQVLWAKRLH